MNALFKQINSNYFWDIDLQSLDEVKSKRLIIERVMSFGTIKEIVLLKSYYGKNEIIENLCNLNYIDSKNLNFYSLLFNVPKSDFKCYTRKQLNHQHWNY